MRYWVQYHNYERLGELPSNGFGINTDKPEVFDTVEDTIFLIVGVSEPRQYLLWERFVCDEVFEARGSRWRYAAVGENGWKLQQPTGREPLLNRQTGFREFLQSAGNFSLGFHEVTNHPFLNVLLELSERYKPSQTTSSPEAPLIEDEPPTPPRSKDSGTLSDEGKVTFPETLRAISIINPFAWLIGIGEKPYEYRSWDTSFRGLCLLHVSGSTEYEAEFSEFLNSGEITKAEIASMRKSIIGFAEVTGTVWDEEYQQWAHRMEKPALFNEVIPCPGALNYWKPYPNKPEQTTAFQQAWELIQAGDYIKADPNIYLTQINEWGLEPPSALKYPFDEQDGKTGSGGAETPSTQDVEKAAIFFVTDCLEAEGWTVLSVEHENCGYDLLCFNDEDEELHVEVKGISGKGQQFIISQNEVDEINKKESEYLLAVVNQALESPSLALYSAEDFLDTFNLKVKSYTATPKTTK